MKNIQQIVSRQLNFSFTKLIIFIIGSFIYTSCQDNISKPHTDYPKAIDSLSCVDSSSLHFFVLSDWGFSGDYGQLDVAEEMTHISKLVGLNFILTCGDNFQIAGVDSINDPLWYENYESIYTDSALLVPWYPALGNHDYLGNPDAEVAYSATSKYWKMTARYYSFVEKIDSANSARFIVLDTPGLVESYQNLSDTTQLDSIPQYVWVKNLLAQSTEKWIFVTGHYPVFSASLHHGDTYEMKKLIKPLFDQYKVDFYICGHDHNFEHARETGKYTDYIVTGTGGYVRTIGANERTIYSVSAIGFTYITVNRNSAKLYFITADGKIDYSYEKKK